LRVEPFCVFFTWIAALEHFHKTKWKEPAGPIAAWPVGLTKRRAAWIWGMELLTDYPIYLVLSAIVINPAGPAGWTATASVALGCGLLAGYTELRHWQDRANPAVEITVLASTTIMTAIPLVFALIARAFGFRASFLLTDRGLLIALLYLVLGSWIGLRFYADFRREPDIEWDKTVPAWQQFTWTAGLGGGLSLLLCLLGVLAGDVAIAYLLWLILALPAMGLIWRTSPAVRSAERARWWRYLWFPGVDREIRRYYGLADELWSWTMRHAPTSA
jgi:hypothetical protein